MTQYLGQILMRVTEKLGVICLLAICLVVTSSALATAFAASFTLEPARLRNHVVVQSHLVTLGDLFRKCG